ncbi:phosphatidic acid phosphatase [Arthrobacter pityocampae]|uniref:phosphatidic acid phosphatase n=1 Tax=Arthrobacter pityocampae TaxID=547334 RepID=UPI001F4DC8C1|nr:phosphatidic acid phosphatase [Arthrobacter pityocampae]
MTATRTAPTRRSRAHRIAAAISELCAPAVLVTLFLVATAIGAAGWPGGALQAGVAATFTTVLPLAAVLVLVRAGRLTDHHISERRQRAPVLAGTLLSIGVGLCILALLDAPWALVAAVWCTVAGVALVLVVNLWWKLSAHSAVAVFVTCGAVTIAGPAALLLLPMPVAVGWSRVRLGAHTAGQVAAGFLVGGVIGLAFAAVVGNR